ncbi:hypothetical protein Megpolyxen_01587 (plasmid) [Candidatus Megaera polyxenophila]|nr:hypothetical protein Megpolyxen_01587 [Candidatus Megaera polyxenophila]
MKIYSTNIVTITKSDYLHAYVNRQQIIIDFINQLLIALIDKMCTLYTLKK